MHLIIYGPEGSGKGTQAEKLGKFFNLPVYTSGDLVREAAAKSDDRLGKICRQALTLGNYVPDEEMFLLWKKKLKSAINKKGFILDGFPRNINQAKFLFKEIEKYDYQIDKVIYLKIGDEQSIERLSKRSRKLFKGSNLSHDTRHRIVKRLTIYHQQEKKLLDFYREKNIILEIDASKSIDQVFEDILKGLKN